MTATMFRMYHEKLGGHVHCRLFAGSGEGALGQCGRLVMRTDEFEVFKAFAKFIQFREEKNGKVIDQDQRSARH